MCRQTLRLVALVNPNTRSIGRVATTNPPFGLLYLVSILRNAGHEPTFIDADVDDLHEGHVAYKVAIADLVGITMVSLQASAGYRLVNFLKFVHPLAYCCRWQPSKQYETVDL